MSFTLQVDAVRWRENADAVRDKVRAAVRGDGPAELGDLVPVAKGNGYGLGNQRLAREAARLGVDVLAVGTVHEVDQVAAGFGGDILVLTPVEPADTVAAAAWDRVEASGHGARVVRTVASPAGLAVVVRAARDGTPRQVVLEGLTSIGRFGLTPQELTAALSEPSTVAALDDGRLVLVGLALHLPLTQPSEEHRAVPGARWHDTVGAPAWPADATGRVREVLAWSRGWQQLLGDVQAGSGPAPPPARVAALTHAPGLWLSHLSDAELVVLRGACPGVPLRLRAGTRLWLGDRAALAAQGTVLARHQLDRGARAGYRQHRLGRGGTLLVVAGGTAHGVALAAPTPAASLRQRAVAAGSGVLESAGRSLSPFTVAGSRRWFAEPPHMQVSLLRLPPGIAAPAVGEPVPCDLRLTTASFDRVVGLD